MNPTEGVPIGLAHWMRRRAQITPDRRALTFNGETTSFGRLQERIERLATGLRDGGVGPGDRVGYLGQNHPAFFETLFATAHLGAVFVPLNWRLTGPELAFIIGDADVHTLVVDDLLRVVLEGVRDGLDVRRYVTTVGGVQGWDALDEVVGVGSRTVAPAPTAGEDVALLMYTSGTTGRPKGAMLTHANLFWNNVNVLHAADISVDDVTLVCAPLFHIGGLNVTTLCTWQKGGEVVLMGGFDEAEVLRLIPRHRVTTMFGVPAMFQLIRQHPAFSATDLGSSKFLVCGGAPVPEPLIEAYSARSVTFLQAYGLTETAPFALLLSRDQARSKVGSAGLPLPYTEVELRGDDPGRPAPPGTRGEVVVRGPNVMKGYWRQPDATREAISADGWFRTGDVGTVDEAGYFYIVDRVKDVVITGGENVYPAEVENVLFEHPAVRDAAIIGLADERWGEVVTAVVVLDGERPVDLDGLRVFAADRLARYKLPTRLEVVDELPRNAAGKVLKRALREQFEAGGRVKAT